MEEEEEEIEGNAETPILTQVYRTIATLVFIAGLWATYLSINDQMSEKFILIQAAVYLTAFIFALGIAEVIHLIAKIEFNTRK